MRALARCIIGKPGNHIVVNIIETISKIPSGT